MFQLVELYVLELWIVLFACMEKLKQVKSIFYVYIYTNSWFFGFTIFKWVLICGFAKLSPSQNIKNHLN